MKSRHIYLVSFRRPNEIYPPLGLMYVADALEKSGFSTEIFHITEEHILGLISQVQSSPPLFVGFSTVTGPTLIPTIAASRQIHSLGTPVVWGGVHATIMPREILKEAYVDFVVVNEGEETASQLARYLVDSSQVSEYEISGLAFHGNNGRPVLNQERTFIEDLDRYRPRWEKIDLEKYVLKSGPFNRAMPLLFSRGCPFRCGFCYNCAVMKSTWRRHSPEFMEEQIQWLKKHHHIEAIDYADDYLFGEVKLMQTFIERSRMPWSGQVRIHLLSPEFTRWLKKTHCQWINIGIESGAQTILDRIDKDLKLEQIDWGLQNLITYAPDIEVNLSFMVAFPGETKQERNATLDLIEKSAARGGNIRASLNFYMPFPQTPLWENALKHGFQTPENQEDWGRFDTDRSNLPWLNTRTSLVMRDINAILFVGKSRGHWMLKPYYRLLRWRWHRRFFKCYWEGALIKIIHASPLGPTFRRIIKRVVKYQALTHKGQPE